MATRAATRTTTYRLRQLATGVLCAVGLVLAAVIITGVAAVPTVALLMCLVPAIALSPTSWGRTDATPGHLPRWARLARIAQIVCVAVGCGLAATQLLGADSYALGRIALLLLLAGLFLTVVLNATTWSTARPEPQR